MKLKNSIKRLLRMAGYLLFVAGLVVLLGMIARRERRVPCRAVEVHIADSLQLGFVTGEEVKALVMKSQGTFLGKPMKNIDTRKIEEDLLQQPYIQTAQAYKDVSGVLHIEVRQRKPVVKIFPGGGKIIFLDDQGFLLPFSSRYPVHLLVASGNIPLPKGKSKYRTVDELSEESPLHDIYKIALFIEKDPFWKAQIEQIWVNKKGEYRLTPRVGSHAIILGDAEDLQVKFRKLYALYTHALNNLGWNRYTKINLTFKNQIVCTLR